MSASSSLYRTALSYLDGGNIYPNLAGHADFALPYIGRLVRRLSEPQFANPQSQAYFIAQIRDKADEYTFTTEFIKATQFYRRERSQWTDADADNMGRAYHDMILHSQPENVSI